MNKKYVIASGVLIVLVILFVVLFIGFKTGNGIFEFLKKQEIKTFDNSFSEEKIASQEEMNFLEEGQEVQATPVVKNTFNLELGDLVEENIPSIQNHQGYLIEFEREPLAVKKLELDQEKEIKENSLFFRIFGKGILTGNTIQEDLEEYKQNLREENREIKQRISQKLSEQGKTLEILNEHEVLFNGIFVDFSDSEAKLIENVEGVKKVHPNLKVYTTLMDSVPLINADDVWNLNKDLQLCDPNAQTSNKEDSLTGDTISPRPYINLEGTCLTGKNISIAIIDTGIDYTHPDLGGCFGENCKVKSGYDFVNNDDDPMDDHGHGTHCAGIAAGKGILDGVAPDADLYAYKVLNEEGWGSWEWVIAGMEMAIDPNQDGNFEDHLDVISMSLGGSCLENYNEFCGPDDLISYAVDNAASIGSVMVIAASNDGPNEGTIGTPGTARKAITVGASDKQDQITFFSSRGPVIWENSQGQLKSIIKPDMIAPGKNICSSQWENAWQYNECIDDEHTAISGTSMATPHVAGAIALLKQKNPEWTPEELKIALKNTAVDIGEEIIAQGQGRIDILEAIKLTKKPLIVKLNEIDYFPEINLNISGTAKGENFNYYKVYYLDEIENWNLICQGNQEVEEDLLCENFNVESLIDEKYHIKLEVYKIYKGDLSKDYGIFEIDNIKILNPLKDYAYNSNSILNIQLEILNSANFYSAKILDENGYSLGPLGINIINNTFATWDASLLDKGTYDLVLTFELFGTYFEEKVENIYLSPNIIESNLKEGWPIFFDYNVGITPTVQDLNNDGNKEIIFRNVPWLHVYNYLGQVVEGWPQDLNMGVGVIQPYLIPPVSIGKTNQDSEFEIFAGGIEDSYSNALRAYGKNGSLIQNWPANITGIDYDVASFFEDAITVAPFGIVESGYFYFIQENTVYFSFPDGHYLLAFDKQGNKLPGNWPIHLESNITPNNLPSSTRSSSVLGDVDKDGDIEIVVLKKLINDYTNSIYKSIFLVLDKYGNIENEFEMDSRINSPQILFDWDKDGDLEIIVLGFNGPQTGINIFNHDGTLIKTFFVPSTNMPNSFMIGDFNNDQELEFFYGQRHNSSCGMYSLVNDQGISLEGWPLQICKDAYKYEAIAPPVIADINNDNYSDIIFSTSGGIIYGFDHTGELIYFQTIPLELISSGVVINDIDSNGFTDLIVSTVFEGGVYIWELENTHNPLKMDWPMFQHDPSHTGNYHACSDGTLPNQCTSPKPKYCSNKILINNCQECGCPGNLACLSNGVCSIVAPKNITFFR